MDYKPGDFKDAKVAVLGFGVNNQSLTRWLIEQGASVLVCDENPNARKLVPDLLDKVSWQLGKDAFRNLSDYDYLFRTPGLRPDHPKIEEALAAGKSRLTSQTELFFALCPATIIGITGTKGKGTTASLLFSALKEGSADAGFNQVYLAGNIGKDPFEYLSKLQKGDCVILELSSFQLFQAKVRPKVAIMLSLSPDHLDWHTNMHEYAAAKSSLVRNQTTDDIAIFNAESEHLKPFLALTKAQVYLFSRSQRVNRGAYVAFDEHRQAVFMTGEKEPLLYATDLSIPGEHNLENAAAAALAAYLLGVTRQTIRASFAKFTGLPHRLQLVAKTAGVDFIDDSIATTPESMVAAVEAFLPARVHLLAGGVSKVDDMSEAIAQIDDKIASVTLIGRNQQDMAESFNKQQPFLAHNMEEAIRHIIELLQPNDVVVLSPAGSSFDMYANYAARGDDFKARVESNREAIINRMKDE